MKYPDVLLEDDRPGVLWAKCECPPELGAPMCAHCLALYYPNEPARPALTQAELEARCRYPARDSSIEDDIREGARRLMASAPKCSHEFGALTAACVRCGATASQLAEIDRPVLFKSRPCDSCSKDVSYSAQWSMGHGDTLCEACWMKQRTAPAPKFKPGDRVQYKGPWCPPCPGFVQEVLSEGDGSFSVCVSGNGVDRTWVTAERLELEPGEPLKADLGSFSLGRLAAQMHRENLATGGQHSPEELARCLHRTELHLVLLKRWERDMGLLDHLGMAFAKTDSDYSYVWTPMMGVGYAMTVKL